MTVTVTSSCPVIVGMSRTPIGRRGGSLAHLSATDLGALVLEDLVARLQLDERDITDIIMGCTLAPEGNPARVAALKAGFGVQVPALTIDRQCGSGINAVVLAAQTALTGGKIVLAGGLESMTHEPFQLERTPKPFPSHPPGFLRRELSTREIGDPVMGITAENLASRYGISRREQDEYAARSQERMARAQASGIFEDHMVSVPAPDGSLITVDEHPRPTTTVDKLSRLKPVFQHDGTVTAGNASGINDGAAALAVATAEEACSRGYPIRAVIRGWTVAGVDPNVMGIGPVPAIEQLLVRTARRLEDIDHLEINEAFAVQVLACAKELGVPPGRLNPLGGAIAHGHPIAATGGMLIAKAICYLERNDLRTAIVAACIGGGQGIAVLIERPEGTPK